MLVLSAIVATRSPVSSEKTDTVEPFPYTADSTHTSLLPRASTSLHWSAWLMRTVLGGRTSFVDRGARTMTRPDGKSSGDPSVRRPPALRSPARVNTAHSLTASH